MTLRRALPRPAALLLALAVAGAREVHAGNGISAITVRVERNLTSVALKAIVSGDDDSSAVLRIFQRRHGAGDYDTGMVMARRVGFGPAGQGLRQTGGVYEGRILWLAPGKLVEYYIEGADAGGGVRTAVDTVSCARARPAVTTGPIFHVDAAGGDDRNDGTKDRPKRTINAALDALAASPGQGANGGVSIAPGEYHERLDLDDSRFPTDGAHRFLEGDGTNRDSTILCGANPWLERGLYAPGKPLRWTATGQGATWKCHLPAGTGPADTMQLVVLGWGEYLHRKTSIRAVLDDSTYAYTPASLPAREPSGWFWQNDTLYVKRRSAKSPAGLALHVGYLHDLILVKRRNWRIANLTIRYSGGPASAYLADVNPRRDGHGITAGLQAMGSGLAIEGCRFYGHSSAAVYVVHGYGGFKADSVTVAGCSFDGLGIGRMHYGAGKSRVEEHAGSLILRSAASSVLGNTFTDLFNGVETGGGGFTPDSTMGSGVEIANNTFTHLSDDAIELDTSHNLNTLVVGNTMRDVASGISLAPTYAGPIFVFYNSITDFRARGVKGGAGNTGLAHFVHNTIASLALTSLAVDLCPGGSHDGSLFVNNILVGGGTRGAIQGPPAGGEATNSFNFDLVEAPGAYYLAGWAGRVFDLERLRRELGFERNGRSGAKGFVDPTRGDWSLAPTSPAVDAGRRWTGVNTGLDGPRYSGAAPDIGAAERAPR